MLCVVGIDDGSVRLGYIFHDPSGYSLLPAPFAKGQPYELVRRTLVWASPVLWIKSNY